MSIKLTIILSIILPSAISIYHYNVGTLRNLLECGACASGTFSRFRFNNTLDYSITCQYPNGSILLNRTFPSGLYYINICGGAQASLNLFCSENGIFPAIDSDALQGATLLCIQSFDSLLLLTASTQCEGVQSCSKDETCGTSTTQCTGTGYSSIYNGVRCQAQVLCNSQLQKCPKDSNAKCCYFDCENVTCVNKTCDVTSTTNIASSSIPRVSSVVPTPTASHILESIQIMPTASHIVDSTQTMSTASHVVPTPSVSTMRDPRSTVFPTPSIQTTLIPTSVPNITTILQQNTLLIIATAIPGAVIGIIVILTGLAFILLAVFCFRYRKKESKSPIKDANNYENIGRNDNNAVLNPVFDATNVNRESIETQEPLYSEIPDNRLSDPNGYVYASYNTLKPPTTTDNEKQTSVPKQKCKEEMLGANYQYVINELYSDMVEGEVMNHEFYEEFPSSRIASKQLFSPNDSLEMNPVYKFNQEYPTAAQPFVEPPNSLPDLENNLKCCLFQIRREQLDMGAQFASGHFGLVYRATYHTHKGDIPVAVKSLRQTANSDTKRAFMREAATLSQFNHPNVLRLIGVLTTEQQQQQEPWMIVTELLRTELRELLLKLKTSSHNSPSPQPPQGVVLHTLLLKFSQEVAAGMAYLTEKKFIHRDLAARNVLVAKDLSIRVADFGMSREVDSPENNYYTSSGGRVPLRWTAPEAVFYMKYSEKSDVWSFGMTLYEIWSLGDKPWGGASNEEIIQALSVGRTLSAPVGCPDDVYQVMLHTWMADRTARPTFNQLRTMLSNVNLSFYHKLSEVQ